MSEEHFNPKREIGKGPVPAAFPEESILSNPKRSSIKALGPRKLTKEQMEAASPRSFWPFVLAITIFITCVGLLIHPILFFCGVVLMIGSITGWLLERRSYLR